jgi:hypothetical protein
MCSGRHVPAPPQHDPERPVRRPDQRLALLQIRRPLLPQGALAFAEVVLGAAR